MHSFQLFELIPKPQVGSSSLSGGATQSTVPEIFRPAGTPSK